MEAAVLIDCVKSTLLEMHHVSKVYAVRTGFVARRKVNALSDFSMNMMEGETVALVGSSGSGKSTVAKLIVRLIDPTSGRIFYKGQDITELKRKELKDYRKRVQMLFQDPYYSLDPTRTVEWHIRRPLRLMGLKGSQLSAEVERLLESVQLIPPRNYAYKFPHELSGGQRQRVFLARILALKPELIVADEPVSMLDASLRAEILTLVRSLIAESGISVLYITHDMSTIRYLASRIYVMNAGTSVESGPTERVIESPSSPYTRQLIDSTPDPYMRIQ